jgi:hypothetical protein
MPVPDFSPGEVLTAAAMDSIGLWKVGSVTAGSSSAIVLDNIFTSNYDNYRIVFSCFSIDLAVRYARLQLLDSSGAAITSGYAAKSVIWDMSGTGAAASYDNVSASYSLGSIGPDTNNPMVSAVDIFNPFLSENTGLTGNSQGHSYGLYYTFSLCGGLLAADTVARGIRLISNTGNIQGTITAYGYRKP